MGEPKREGADDLEAAVDQAIAACDGNVRAAVRVLVIANSFLTAENERLARATSLGFRRGKQPARRASQKVDDWRAISSGGSDEQ